ncbi:hypothetical protein BOTCAL_0138g00210 [Botryotinia calthae]|uniref:Uncharacterized protein n=1 Tax=Botryotinia calthae TaxID=38488 RepID=A0A4Y8D3A2_9HELO|nr:hypothetical protein BOTCAL_0138g00210 [Botryotinia calthae]
MHYLLEKQVLDEILLIILMVNFHAISTTQGNLTLLTTFSAADLMADSVAGLVVGLAAFDEWLEVSRGGLTALEW